MSAGRFLFVALVGRANPFIVGWNIMAVTLALSGKALSVGTVLTLFG